MQALSNSGENSTILLIDKLIDIKPACIHVHVCTCVYTCMHNGIIGMMCAVCSYMCMDILYCMCVMLSMQVSTTSMLAMLSTERCVSTRHQSLTKASRLGPTSRRLAMGVWLCSRVLVLTRWTLPTSLSSLSLRHPLDQGHRATWSILVEPVLAKMEYHRSMMVLYGIYLHDWKFYESASFLLVQIHTVYII